jgi:hypothetical protein
MENVYVAVLFTGLFLLQESNKNPIPIKRRRAFIIV